LDVERHIQPERLIPLMKNLEAPDADI